MAIIVPFRGITYNFHSMHDMSRLVTPPYDVISEGEQEEFYRADPHNIIRLILGKRKIGDTDWDNRYTRAADTYRRWESEGILVRANEPCIYLTSHTYDPGDGKPKRTRWGIIVLVRIEDEGSGVILPHEQTFSAHKDDRLRLISACSAQFSQIFGLYEDPSDTIMDACKNAANVPATVSFDFKDGTKHQMWIINNHSLFKKVAEIMTDRPIFIADGHHRYETSRNFRNIMRKKHGRKPANRPYEYVMMYLSNMDNQGLTILPSHRLIKTVPDFDLKSFLETLKRWFTITGVPFKGASVSEDCLDLKKIIDDAGHNNTAMAFYVKDAGQFYVLSLKAKARDEMGVDIHPALKNLDVLVLSRLVFEKALGFDKEQMDNSDIFHYESNIEKAVSEVMTGNRQMVFFLNPTRIEHVKEIAINSLVMPRKSTFFYPKVLTGLVFNKIDPNETVDAF